jgi:hypothetical protein
MSGVGSSKLFGVRLCLTHLLNNFEFFPPAFKNLHPETMNLLKLDFAHGIAYWAGQLRSDQAVDTTV